ncbi:major facilitator superfamily domain-containing protein [Hygrophoropsis aurantiaca]|uniref:Major facilitator superfamily domain-containing protein n=1 Tax=Hygrophoropsis aurantiaca TaxID=72124 RepID=A0ACB8ASG2_9AGAM|nr:major facilitator superfamily domain-containing protein [Hygrophoropsis aurantiaca]
MSFPVNPDADPDPTTQMPWPSARYRQRTASGNTQQTSADQNHSTGINRSYQSTEDGGKQVLSSSTSPKPGRTRLSTWDLITLSISMGGAQIAWTVELGYGTPFLLSLGISEQVTSLVWLAGPISGLIAQPLIGAISDSSTSKYRRRYWVVLSTAFLVLSTLAIAYCQSLAEFFVDLFGGGAGDWDPERMKQASHVAIGIAVFSFYVLDFALNALQASLRNLLLDVTPPEQLNAGNAWHSRMSQAGNIVGYGFGFLPLAKLPFLRFLGGDQFRKFCVLSMTVLVVTVWITCFCHEEKASPENKKPSQNKFYEILENIHKAITTLPKPIRRVCLVQLFAFMGWFPFLFYSTTYVGQVMAYQDNKEPDIEVATRIGEFAMLLYSLVAVGGGVLLPHLARRDRRLLPRDEDDEDAHVTRLRGAISGWREEAASKGKVMKLPRMPWLLRNIWAGAMLLFTILTFSTFFITTVNQAIVAISLIGICWSVACWVPFAIIMEFLKEMNLPTEESVSGHSQGTIGPDEEQEDNPLISRPDNYDGDSTQDTLSDSKPVAGGTILGIHNLSIVLPQFVVALVASTIFRIVDHVDENTDDHNKYLGKNGVAWVLRFGGLCTLLGALICRTMPPTRTEKQMQRQLAELKALKEENEP